MWQSRLLLLWSGKAKAALKLYTENKKETKKKTYCLYKTRSQWIIKQNTLFVLQAFDVFFLQQIIHNL